MISNNDSDYTLFSILIVSGPDTGHMFPPPQFQEEVSWHRSDSVDFVDDDLTVTYDLETTVWPRQSCSADVDL